MRKAQPDSFESLISPESLTFEFAREALTFGGMQYPKSVLTGSASTAFLTVLHFHLHGDAVLDLTYGDGISWREAGLFTPTGLVRSDIKPSESNGQVKQDLFTAFEDRPTWREAFDLVYYDPPYMCDVARSLDPRANAYGGYNITDGQLRLYQEFVPSIRKFLKPGGKVIVKCSDQYHVPTRRLMLHHLDWCNVVLKAFNLVDFFIYTFRRVSPTAYQVKDRPSSIVAHTYFIVGQTKEEQ